MRTPLFQAGFLRPVLLLTALLALSACGGGSGTNTTTKQVSETGLALVGGAQVIESYTSTAAPEPSSFKTRQQGVARAATVVDLGSMIAPKAIAEEDRQLGAPRKIGSSRNVAQTSSSAGTAASLNWKTAENGTSTGSVTFVSGNAVGIRLGLLVRRLPGIATVRVYGNSGQDVFEAPGREVLATIDRNVDAGDKTDEGRTYWTPAVQGEEATLEIQLPPGTLPATVDISVPRVSHLYESFERAESVATKIGESGACEADVSCRGDYSEESKSVARMIFTKSGGTFACTGTLMADVAKTGKPYFLSANHCISDQTVASTLTTYWFYRSSSCNSGALNLGAKMVSGGATLLYNSSSTDTSFLILAGGVPSGSVFAGSSPSAAPTGTLVTGLHNPRADLQKISDGTVQSYAICTESGGSPSCSSNQPNGSYLRVGWYAGVTEGGSSGSSVFSTIGGKRYVVGQLYAGSSSCANPSGADFYGRFDLAYNASLNQWLNAPTGGTGVGPNGRSAIYRFYNPTSRAHFFTASVAERDYVAAFNDAFQFEGTAFYAYAGSASGLNPVYRFYNASTASHFFTISAGERNNVQQNMPSFSYEGASWYASTAAISDSRPLYRFYNPSAGNHFYTISNEEKTFVQMNNPSYVYEGIGYYGWLSP